MSAPLKSAGPDTEPEGQAALSLINSFSRKLGVIGLDVHDAATNIADVTREFDQLEAGLQALRQSAGVMVGANRQIDGAT